MFPDIVTCDALIVGDGPAACAAAIALRSLQASVIVLCRARNPRPEIQTVSPRIVPLVAHLGVWDTFQRAGFFPADGISSAWGSDDCLETDYYFRAPGIGWHLHRPKFDELLRARARELACQFLPCTRLVSVCRSRNGHGWQVVYASADHPHRRKAAPELKIHSRHLVDATGRRSATARFVGARRVLVDRQVAIAMPIDASGGVSGAGGSRLRLEAGEWGWWYFAPGAPDGSLVAFVTDSDLLPRKAEPRRRFLSWLWSRSRVLPRYLDQEPRFDLAQVMRAETSFLDDNVKRGWLAIGDAAFAADPLSGDGLARALEAGIEGAAFVRRCLDGEKSPKERRAAFRTFATRTLRTRQQIFSLERRWPTSPFWNRRQFVASA